jgi:hypothetical protein
MTTQREQALGALVRKYRAASSQEAVAEMLSRHLGEKVRQNMVSLHEKGERWHDPKWRHAYIAVLGIPQDEMVQAEGYSLPGREGPKTFREIVLSDPTLSKAAKEHLVNQYGLLQLASKNSPDVTQEEAPSDAHESRR